MGTLLKNYVLAAGQDALGGLVLQKIDFWCAHNAKKGRPAETALSRTQLADQIGCTEEQARRAAERLVRLGLLVKSVRMFGRDRVCHWQLTETARQAVVDGHPCPTGRACTPKGSGMDAQLVGHHSPALYSDHDSGHDSGHLKPSDPSGPSGELVQVRQKVSEESISEEEGKAVALMKDVRLKPIDKSKGGLSPKSAEAFWKDAWATHKTSFCLPLQVKDAKALVVLATACQAAGIGFDTFLARCHTEWPAIAAYAKEQGGAYSIPSEPSIHWMVQWRQPIFGYLMKPAAPASQLKGWEPSAPKVVPSAPPVQSSAKPSAVDDDKPVTPEELFKIMSEDD